MSTKQRLRATEAATESMAAEIVCLQGEVADAEAEKAHLKEHLLSLESSNAALQAQLVQAREENRSHLREIGTWRRHMSGVRVPASYERLSELPLEYVSEEC